ncbi:MAG: hypothetical protein IKW08_04190 [Roseburia sp.]|nr:hypothetical protein [Roseburia sp.]
MCKEYRKSYISLDAEEIITIGTEKSENSWNFMLKKKKENEHLDKIILGTYLDFSLYHGNNNYFIEFDIFVRKEERGCGYGTILLKDMLVKIKELEENRSIKIGFAKGWLSTSDKGEYWNNSIPFYLDFPNTITKNEVGYGHVKAEIHLKDEDQSYSIGDVVEDIQDFMNGNQDGCIVYYLD